MKEHMHRVAIIGGGAGGLELAARLGRKFGPRHIILVDRIDNHIWKPSLHEVAAGTLDINREGLSYFVLARQCGFSFVHGSIQAIDQAAKRIVLAPVLDTAGEQIFPRRSMDYDTLVLAIGSQSNFFGTPGASRYAFALDSTIQAEHFRQRLLCKVAELSVRRARLRPEAGAPDQRIPEGIHQAMAADGDQNPLSHDDVLHISIVGGGATGVELAAELVEAMGSLAYYGMSNLEPAHDIRITLLEGAERILSALPEKVSIKALQLLEKKKIMVRTSVRVAAVQSNCILDSEGNQYPADLCVWAAGIEAPAILSGLGLKTNRHHQLIVDAGLHTSDPDIFAFGDCADAPGQDGNRPLPAKAQVASQQAAFLYKTLSARINGQGEPEAVFQFRDYGSLISVGRSEGVGSLMGVLSGRNWFIEGLLARVVYMSLHLRHHIVVLGLLQTSALALGRLLLRRGTPRVKLH